MPVDLTHIVQGPFAGVGAINNELVNNIHHVTNLVPVRQL